MKPILKVNVKVFEWSRYKERLWKNWMDIGHIPDDRGTNYVMICFKHRVAQQLCHCTESINHFQVTRKIAIPKKDDAKAWIKLEQSLRNYPEGLESNTVQKDVSIDNLDKRKRLLHRFGFLTKSIYEHYH